MKRHLTAIKRMGLRAVTIGVISLFVCVGASVPIARALNAGQEAVSPLAMREEVINTYKAFSGLYYVPQYDVTYKSITFHKTYYKTGPYAIWYGDGWYGLQKGKVTIFEYRYELH